MRLAAGVCALLLALSGCATGFFSGGGGRELPPLDPGKGRVYVYRTSTVGSPNIPEVLLNGEHLGRLDQVGMVFKDVPPGSYAVTAARISTVVNFAVAAGERKYVKFSSGFFDKFTHPELVDARGGESAVAGLRDLAQGRK